MFLSASFLPRVVSSLFLFLFLSLSPFLPFSLSLSLFGSFSFARFNIANTRRARRYLCDFSKGEANLNCRSRAILPSFTFPETRLPSLFRSLRFFPSTALFFHNMVLCTTYLPAGARTSRECSLCSSSFGECNSRLTLRSSVICGRDSRSARVLERKKRQTRGERRSSCVRAVKGKSKRVIRQSLNTRRIQSDFRCG